MSRNAEIEILRQRLKEELRKNRKTTLLEYLRNCHFHLYKLLELADKTKCSTGQATKVNGAYYPTFLYPWNDFTGRLRQQHFKQITEACGEDWLFKQESTSRDLGTAWSDNPAGNENAIDFFEKLAVKMPVSDILKAVFGADDLRKKYNSGGLRFCNNFNDFTQRLDHKLG